MTRSQLGLGRFLEACAAAAVVLLAAAACHRAFLAAAPDGSLTFSTLRARAAWFAEQSDPAVRDAMCFSIAGVGRALDAQLAPDARLFVTNMLGPENSGRLGYYYFLTYYLFPREVAISLEPPAFALEGMSGRNPTSDQELAQAGFDLALHATRDGVRHKILRPLAPLPPEVASPPPARDRIVAFLLPLAVALAGRRMVRWLFRPLAGALSAGECLACGLGVGAFFLTQFVLALRMAGLQLERELALAIGVWAGSESALWIRSLRANPPRIGAGHAWWLLLIPAALMSACLFLLAGLECLTEFDAVAFWVFKAKLLHHYAGRELMAWFENPGLAYAHLDYPLLVSLLHAFTFGALGHENDLVTRFWNQWMLVLLAWALLGAARFPERRPWLIASAVTAMVLIPLMLEYSRAEGAATPMLFYTGLASIQLTLGLLERQECRLRLGLLLLMAAAMVKFDGMLLLALWCALLLLEPYGRELLLSPRRWGWPAAAGLAAWIPYFAFRLQGPVAHPESAWLRLLANDPGAVLQMLPTTWKALISPRLFHPELAAWTSRDGQAVLWSGRWTGWESLIDPSTLGLPWVCLLLLSAVWASRGPLRAAASRLAAVFLLFSIALGLVWSAIHSQPPDYGAALSISGNSTGGRYLFPALLAWFLGSALLLVRAPSPRGASVSPQSPR
jgi:hypothetical protein